MLSCTIDKYCWITARHLPPFFSHKNRVVWSKIELVNSVDEIVHPSARECLKMAGLDSVEVHYDGDLPGQSGLGSSSSFTVAMLHALHSLKGRLVTKEELATQAIEIEQKKLGENVGCQDQVAAAFGGLNRIWFRQEGDFSVQAITSLEIASMLESHMTMFFVGNPRAAPQLTSEYIVAAEKKRSILDLMRSMVDDGVRHLARGDMRRFGSLLHESWGLKRELSGKISTDEIDAAYSRALAAGAWGGKLLGAGGGGFLLVFRPPERATAVSLALAPQLEVGFKLDRFGSQVVHYS